MRTLIDSNRQSVAPAQGNNAMELFLRHQDLLASTAFRSFVLLLLTAGIGYALRRRSAAVRHGIWAVGLGGCLAMPVVVAISPSWTLPLLPPGLSNPTARVAEAKVSQPASRAVTFARANKGDGNAVRSEPPSISQPAETLREPSSQKREAVGPTISTAAAQRIARPSLGTEASAIWGVGFCAVLARLVQQLVVVKRKSRQANDLHSPEWRAQQDVAAQRLGVRTTVPLKLHSGAFSPMVVGWFWPVIVLPGDADTWPNERRLLVLLHELAHVKRRDVLTQTMACLVCALNWFNPICWYGLAQMRKLREMACDDLVLTSGQQATEYADALLNIARAYRHRDFSTAVGMAHTSNVENRILAILDKARSRVSMSRRAFRAFLLLATALVLLVGSLRLQSRAESPAGPNQSAEDMVETAPAAEEDTTKADENFRRMEVQITDEEGEPLEGAKLHIGVWYVEGYQGEKVPKQYFADSRGIVELKLPRRLQILRMWPSKPGYVPLFVNFAEGKHEEGRLIPDKYEFQLKKGHRLSGRVVDEAGKPVSNAKVQVRVEADEPAWGERPDSMVSSWLTDTDFNSPAPVTDSEGRWSITNAPGPPEDAKKDFEFQLQVTHPEFAGDTRWGELQKGQGIRTQDLRSGTATLRLKSGLVIAGEVVGPKGQPITKGWVVWSDEPYFSDGVFETELKPDGSFRTPPLHPGEHPITIVAPGFAAQRRLVEVESESSNLRFQLKRGKRIEIRFVDSAGKPIPEAGVYLANSSAPNTWNGSNALHNHKHPNVPDYGIPRKADKNGVFVWDWAPEEPVNYSVGARGFASHEVSLVAKSEPHVITLADARVVTGMLTDAITGEPVKSFLAMPVIVFQPDFYHTRTTDAKVGQDGKYELPLTGSGDPKDHYRVRFEADGYCSVVTVESFGPLDGRATLNCSLQPAPPRKGRVVDADGQPVEKATILEASPTDVPDTSNGKPESWDSRPISSDAEGNFQVRATSEPVRVRAYHNLGFAEKALAPDADEVGVLELKPWSRVSGRLLQEGTPVSGQTVYFYPLVRRGLTEARFQDSYYAQTDADGSFEFDRIPPINGSLKAHLGPWKDSPLTSSESIPLELRPGEHRQLTLGGDGVTITGRVIATGRKNEGFSKQWSLNYLVSRDDGMEYPKAAEALSFDPSGPLQPAWLRQPDFNSWLATRWNYFVKLSDDGELRVHGVEPGEYGLVIQLYEQPAGCLVETVGEKILPVTVTADHATSGKLAIGDIEVPCRIGPRVGSDMRAFQFTDASGRAIYVDDMKGQHILLHAWATWCPPCLESMPTLKATVERYAKSPLTVVGLNVDEDAANAREMAKRQQMNWAQNYLGADSDLMRQLAVSSVPAYYLIGPDGKLVGLANKWEEIEKLISTAFK
ncbi:MAG: M56 family metallopeptidase [Pirellulales bacterium]